MIVSPPSPSSSSRHTSGFTLLEMVLAILLLTMLVGMVFGTAQSSLALGHTVVENQNQEMLEQAFFDLMSDRFATLPGDTRFDLKVTDSGKQYLTDLTLQNVPLGFTWGGQQKIAKAVQISTVPQSTGYLNIVLRYYEDEILEDTSSDLSSASVIKPEPFAEIVLLRDVRFFEWNLLDGRTMEWQYDWDLQGRLPLQAELRLAFGAQGPEIRHVFWIPPKQNPETFLRTVLQSSGSSSQSRGGS